MKKTLLLSLLSVVLLFGCAPVETVTESEPAPAGPSFTEEDVKKLADDDLAFEEALNSGDLDTLLSFYADDAVVLAFGGSAAQGHDAIREVFMGLPPVKDLKLTTDSTVGYGNFVHQRGRIAMTVLGEDGSETPFAGDFLVTRERDDDGNWKYTNDMFSGGPVAE